MKNLLKYLIPFIMVLAFIDGADKSDSYLQDIDCSLLSSDTASFYSDCSNCHSDFSLPRQISTANGARIVSTNKRQGGSYKNNSEFIKAGTIVNSFIRHSVQKKALIISASCFNPNLRLVTLCKFII